MRDYTACLPLANLVHRTRLVPIRSIFVALAIVTFAAADAAAQDTPVPRTTTDIVDFLMLNQAVPTADF